MSTPAPKSAPAFSASAASSPLGSAGRPAKGFFQHPLIWVPSLYLAMGIPFNVIMSGTASNMYKSLGYSNAEITIALGSIGVAWSLKPLWAAFLDMYRTKKFFVLLMELLLAGLFVAVAMSIPASGFFQTSLALLWVAAFASSTQDICADGIYLTALDKPAQAKFAGVQGMFWVTGKVVATGGFVLLMTTLQQKFGWSEPRTWQMVMFACAGSMVLLFAWHYWLLPSGSITERPHSVKQVFEDFGHTAVTFFHKRAFWGMMAFVCLYRLGEGLILMEGQLFLRSAVADGGLGMSAHDVSTIDAGWATGASIVGGLLGGWFAGRMGLSRSLWVLGLCLNLPHLTFVILSHYAEARHGLSYEFVTVMVSIEKFGYGFGMVGNMIYMMQQLAPGRRTMTHYAFATALMNLMLVPTNMISGPLADLLGFSTFFLVVMAASIPSVWAAWKAPFPLKTEEMKTAEGASESSQVLITVDDPTRLSDGEKRVQSIAGRASTFAMLVVLSVLVLDAMILGWLHSAQANTSAGFFGELILAVFRLLGATAAWSGKIFFGVLIACALLKVWLSLRAVGQACEAINVATPMGETNYRGNARGAIGAVVVCAVLSVAVLVAGGFMAFQTVASATH